MKDKANGWAIAGWLTSIVLFLVLVFNSFDEADTLSTLLKEFLLPLIGEPSKQALVFCVAIPGVLILTIGFLGGIFVSLQKQKHHLAEFNGLYKVKNKSDKEEVLHIIYIWNKPPLVQSGHEKMMIYCQYHRSSLHTEKKRINTFLYGLTCPVDANDPNNANSATLYGEENGLKLLVEIKNCGNDNTHTKITLDLFEKDQYSHIPDVKSEKKEIKSLSCLKGNQFFVRFEEMVAKIVADEWGVEQDKLPNAIQMRTTESGSLKGG